MDDMTQVTGRRTVNWRGLIRDVTGAVYQPPLSREREFYRRLRELNETISAAPDDITQIVLRGELLLERGEYVRAKQDFERALALANKLDDAEAWHILEQIMRDRAAYGMRIVQRHEQSASQNARG